MWLWGIRLGSPSRNLDIQSLGTGQRLGRWAAGTSRDCAPRGRDHPGRWGRRTTPRKPVVKPDHHQTQSKQRKSGPQRGGAASSGRPEEALRRHMPEGRAKESFRKKGAEGKRSREILGQPTSLSLTCPLICLPASLYPYPTLLTHKGRRSVSLFSTYKC